MLIAIGRDLRSAAGEQLRLMGYFGVTAKLLNVDLHLLAIYFPRVGLLETLAGVPFFFVTPRAIEGFVVLLTAPELSEDPNDWVATTISRSVHQLSTDTTFFAGPYLVIYGLIKIFLVAGLLRGKFWA